MPNGKANTAPSSSIITPPPLERRKKEGWKEGEREGGPEDQICHGSGRKDGRKERGKVQRHGDRPSLSVRRPRRRRRQGVQNPNSQPPSLPHSLRSSMEEEAISPVTQVSPTRKLKQEVQRRSENEIESNRGHKLHMRSVSSCAPH